MTVMDHGKIQTMLSALLFIQNDQDDDERWEDLFLDRYRQKTLSEDEYRLEDEAQTQTQQS